MIEKKKNVNFRWVTYIIQIAVKYELLGVYGQIMAQIVGLEQCHIYHIKIMSYLFYFQSFSSP